MIGKFVTAATQVLFVGLIVGAGLPAVFAIGVRSLAAGAAGSGAAGSDAAGTPVGGAPRGSKLAPVFGICCFVLVVAAVAIGITIIVASGFGKTVSFEHVIPTLVNKK